MGTGLVAYDEIETFIENGWIEDVLFLVKSGKEASVYCCRASPGRGDPFFALKVYKPRKNRSFRDAAMYQEGRVITNARTARAVRNKTRFGRAAEFGAWANHEFATLDLLHAAGADVPRPVKAASNAILIEFVSQGGHPAPQLRNVRLSPVEAERLLDQALRNIEIMLSCNIVHGDLSAYNMLYSGGQLCVIDLPQAVDARTNRHAKSLLVRDVANVCGYFAAQGADAKAGTFAEELWDLYLRAQL